MRRWHPFWIGTIAAVVAIAAGAAVVAIFDDDGEPQRPPIEADLSFDGTDDESGVDDLIGGEATGDEAPDTTFALLDGGSMALSDLRGTPVVLNFFAEWCPPCVQEMPDFEAVHQELGDEVAFVGIDVRDAVDKGKEIVEETGVTYTIGRDPSGEIFQSFDAVNMPTTVLLDEDGVVVASHPGALTADELRDLIADKLQ
jgi:cytochrome c biogenesis protein CcmG/thiol:disulfide interchange protein DsbE